MKAALARSRDGPFASPTRNASQVGCFPPVNRDKPITGGIVNQQWVRGGRKSDLPDHLVVLRASRLWHLYALKKTTYHY
jgi:hypothetical protein